MRIRRGSLAGGNGYAELDDRRAAIAALRPQLMSYARSRVRNARWAEDAVSETMLAALERPDAFDGRSALLTWLTGILRHKIVDQLRLHVSAACGDQDDEDCEVDARRPPLETAGAAEQALELKQWMAHAEAALTRLPRRQREAFVLRAWFEWPSEHVCGVLGVSPNHLMVLVHRARKQLRACGQPFA